MLNGDLVFDDRGELRHPSYFFALRRKLPHFGIESDLTADLVRCLGFIALRVRDRRVVITLRTEMVSSVALSSVLYWLADKQPNRVLLVCVSDHRPAELFSDPDAAIARLVHLTKPSAFHSRCSSRSIEVKQLSARSHFHNLVQLWAATSLTRRLETLTDYALKHMHGRYGIIGIRDGEHSYHEIGPSLPIPEQWRVDAIGRPLHLQPDADYWNWAIGHQKQALAKNEPYLARIRVKIYWSTFGWADSDYTRVILPMQTNTGQRYCFIANTPEKTAAVGATHPVNAMA